MSGYIMVTIQNAISINIILNMFSSPYGIRNIVKPFARYLSLLEYQTKDILRNYAVPIQDFVLLDKGTDISQLNLDKYFSAQKYVVKAQVQAGGRRNGTFAHGFEGGIHLTRSKDALKHIVKQMLGNRLITAQTSKEGIEVRKVMIAESVDIVREAYFCLMMDPRHGGPVAIVSPSGGVDIEKIAKTTSMNIGVHRIDINEGITADIAEELALFMQFSHNLTCAVSSEIVRLWKIFIELDALQLEINPLCETFDEKILAIDVKMCVDDNAKFRQKDIFSMEHADVADYREVMASHYNLNFIGMNGDIGCLVNGAGLAMATMDLLSLHGGHPANFLDVGGNVTELNVKVSFDIFKCDKSTKVIFVNIFGGIVDCVTIANGIIAAYAVQKWEAPLVVRFKGNNANEAVQLLDRSQVLAYFVDDFDKAARKAVGFAKNIADSEMIMENEETPTVVGI